ncbi:MAG TPA: diguanylate cyclase [Oscillospiraceae bacterium]|nr:diguanylate cyclase [Oscillospiraceae bacterium]
MQNDKMKILIADNTEVTREMMKNSFQGQFDLLEATDGEEAIEILRRHHESLIAVVLDLFLPKQDGFAVMDYIKRNGLMHKIPVVLCIDEMTNDILKKSFDYGVVDVVTKSDSVRLVYNRVMNAISLFRYRRCLQVSKESLIMEYVPEKNAITILKSAELQADLFKVYPAEDINKYLHPEDMDPVLDILSKLSENDYDNVLLLRIKFDETYRWHSVSFKPIFAESGIVKSIIVSAIDVHEEHERELQLKRMSETDAKTGMKNESAFEMEVTQRLRKMSGKDRGIFVMIDVDGFKMINDIYGHMIGDDVLVIIGGAIRKILRSCDVASRLHGDEFAIWLDGVDNKSFATAVIKTINDMIEEEAVRKEKPAARISAGFAVAMPGSTYPALYKRADKALYFSKEKRVPFPEIT